MGLCNFDAEHTDEICRYLMDKTGEVGIVSNQVQVRPPGPTTILRFRPIYKENGPADRSSSRPSTPAP